MSEFKPKRPGKTKCDKKKSFRKNEVREKKEEKKKHKGR